MRKSLAVVVGGCIFGSIALAVAAVGGEPATDAVTGASKTPPSLTDIAGSYTMKTKVTIYDMIGGSSTSESATQTWTFTPVDPGIDGSVTVSADGDDIGPAYYSMGILVLGVPAPGIVNPADFISPTHTTGVVIFSGKPPKIKATATFVSYDLTMPEAEKGTASGTKQ
jgi:hypothetical protein